MHRTPVGSHARVFGSRRPRAGHTALCADDKSSRIGLQGVAYQALVIAWAVDVGSIDKIDAHLDDAPQHCTSCRQVLGRAPNPLSRQSHGAEAEPSYRKVTPDRELAAFGHIQHFSILSRS